jgi:hypothetical protein
VTLTIEAIAHMNPSSSRPIDYDLMLGLSTNQQMPITLVEPLLCVPGDRAGWCWNFALPALTQVPQHGDSGDNATRCLDDDPAQMGIPHLGNAATYVNEPSYGGHVM